MKHSSFNTIRFGICAITVALAIIVGVVATFAQSKRNRAAKEFMRDKLELSQRVLEGLAIEDYDLIIARGTRLSAMSKEADWRVFENPEYDQQSLVFRRNVDSLVKAARDRNLDAATLAYVRMTMSCVDCHKLVRGKLVASADGLRVPTPAAFVTLNQPWLAPRNGKQSRGTAQQTVPSGVSLTSMIDR